MLGQRNRKDFCYTLHRDHTTYGEIDAKSGRVEVMGLLYIDRVILIFV